MKYVRLTDVCDFQGGTQPPKKEWRTKPKDGYVRMLQIRDFTQSDKKHIEYVKVSSNLKTCEQDDILIGRYGASIGKILTGLSGAYNVAIIKTIPNEKLLLKKYLYYILIGPIFQSFIHNISARAAQAGFNKNDLKKVKIPLPSLDDQTRIATLISKVESLIAKRKKSIADLDELLKSTFLEMFGDPVRNDMGWDTEKLADIALIERGRFSPRPRNDPKFYNGKYPFIQTGDISRSKGRLDQYSQTLNELGTAVSREFKAGTIVIAIVGATIGETAVLKISAYAPDSVIGISPTKRDIDSGFLEYLMRFWKPVLKSQAPEAARANINIQSLKPLKIIIPPIKRIKKFRKIIEKVENLKEKYQNSLSDLEALYGALSQKAFKGELDLSQIPITVKSKPKNITTGVPQVGKPVLTVQDKPGKTPEIREQILHRLFNGFISDAKNGALSLDDFWLEAEEKFMELMDEDAPPIGVVDYDRVRDWLFEMLAQGRVVQVFNEQENRMEIRSVS